LNEGFATYFEWLWSEREGGPTPQQIANDEYNARAADNAFWTIAPAALPDGSELFSAPAYLRGSMTLQALRSEIGDATFFRVLRIWAETNRYGNVTTAKFIALAERESGRNLQSLFKTWLYTPSKPGTAPAPGATAPVASASTARSIAPQRAHLDARAKPVGARR
jgi:aminopeptidase N